MNPLLKCDCVGYLVLSFNVNNQSDGGITRINILKALDDMCFVKDFRALYICPLGDFDEVEEKRARLHELQHTAEVEMFSIVVNKKDFQNSYERRVLNPVSQKGRKK